jgi:hypothetical protein
MKKVTAMKMEKEPKKHEKMERSMKMDMMKKKKK